MARIASKLNWTSDPDNAPLPSDFNRIENNNNQAFDEIDEEVSEREAADTAEVIARNLAIENAIDGISYKGSDKNNIEYPVNTCLVVLDNTVPERNATINVYTSGTLGFTSGFGGDLLLNGVWKCRGFIGLTIAVPPTYSFLAQRIS